MQEAQSVLEFSRAHFVQTETVVFGLRAHASAPTSSIISSVTSAPPMMIFTESRNPALVNASTVSRMLSLASDNTPESATK